jgi:ABC transport system ATP-binding/permease protein
MAKVSVGGLILAQLKGVRLSLGGAPLFEEIDLALRKGERACLVGANGAGKSTLMRILDGRQEADAGIRTLTAGAGIAVVAQEPDLQGFATLLDYAAAPFGAADPTPVSQTEATLAAFGLDPARSPAGLSGGEMRRAALARAFAAAPDVLLLDEPTNHLDIPAIEALEARLAAFRGAALIVSHDRRFLEHAATTCLWLRQGRLLRLDRPYTAFDEWAAAVELEETRQLAKLDTHLKAEQRWLERGVTARRSRNEGRRRKLLAMREERKRRTSLAAAPKAAIEAGKGAESGKRVVEAIGIGKSFGAAPVLTDVSLRILRGDRIGIVGPNGAGKSTLLEILLGRSQPDSGTIRLGTNLEIAYVDQARAGLMNPQDTVWEALVPGGGDTVMVRGAPRHVAAYAKDFLFSSVQLRQPVTALSGGERNRLALAIALAKPANLLALDEPTNDLDMDTLDVLEEALAAYDGTVIVVSHDRAFLDVVATQIVGSLGGGRWAESPGGFADFEREHGAGRAEPATSPRNKPAAAPPSAPVRQVRKLSYKDERRATELEAALPKLEAEIAALEAHLADPAWFGRDAAGHAAAANRLAAALLEKDAAETEWLEIGLRRDALAD